VREFIIGISQRMIDACRQASEMFNFRSPSFKALGLAKDKLSDQEHIDLMLKEPRLIRRPVIKIGDKVYFGASVAILEKILTE
jgi:arsenate reductase-like glutaredoxin family protein